MMAKKYNGLFEKIIPVESDMPESLKQIARNLKNFPYSERLALEAVSAMDAEMRRVAKPIPLLTKRAVVVYNSGTENECGIGYQDQSRVSLRGPQIFEASYSFYLPKGKESELSITVDNTPFKGRTNSLRCVELVDSSDTILASHSFEHQGAAN